MTTHPLVLGLFATATAAAAAARSLRDLGIPAKRVSVVAATHDEEGAIARAVDATPGAELEDSRPASRLAELSAHFLAAAALALPGVGPIVADGPLAAGLGEAAGHLAGGLAKTLARAGLPEAEAEQWEQRVAEGAVLIGAHTSENGVASAEDSLRRSGAVSVGVCRWPD